MRPDKLLIKYKMVYEVDQSNKIEQTERDTVLVMSNGTKFSVVLTRQNKRKLQAIYRDLGEPKVFIYFVFAALLSIAARHSGASARIVVDREYLDHEDLIKLKLKKYLKEAGKEYLFGNITFGFIGKSSAAHKYASQVAAKKCLPTKVVSLREILRILGEEKHKK